jgi:hypothetical protein
MSQDYETWYEYSKRLDPLRTRMYEAEQKCIPPLPKNVGMECCSVKDRNFPRSAMANWVRDMPSKIGEIKECVRLHLLFYCAYQHITEPEDDATDRKRLDELCDKLDRKIQRSQTCENNVVRQWRFIRDKKPVHDLHSFFLNTNKTQTI